MPLHFRGLNEYTKNDEHSKSENSDRVREVILIGDWED